MLTLLEMTFPNIDPVLIPIWDPVHVRWYGLGYLFSFLITLGVMRKLQSGGYLRIAKEDCLSFILWAIIGTLIGGRLGYMGMYTDYFWSGEFFSDPLKLIGFSEGKFSGGLSGLSFHGGLIGVISAGTMFTYIRMKRQWNAMPEKQRKKEGQTGFRKRFRALWCDVFDSSVHGVPLGIAAVRMGNFINGELYGRMIHYDVATVGDDPELAHHLSGRLLGDPTLTNWLVEAIADKPQILAELGLAENTSNFMLAAQISQNPAVHEKLSSGGTLATIFQKAPEFANKVSEIGVTAAQFAPDWAMRFPTTPEAQRAMADYLLTGVDGKVYYYSQAGEAWLKDKVPADLSGQELADAKRHIVDQAMHMPVDPELFNKVQEYLPYRHPSQLYQALGEGLIVFLMIWILRWFFPKRGMVGGMFLTLYAIMRIPAELFRQPDSQFSEGHDMSSWGAVLDAMSLTQGQFLSILMALGGLAMFFMSWRSKNPYMQLDRDVVRFKGVAMTDKEAGLPELKKKEKKDSDEGSKDKSEEKSKDKSEGKSKDKSGSKKNAAKSDSKKSDAKDADEKA